MSSRRLEIIVFLSGAIVMIFELVGSRVLAPYLGTSLYVWTSVIGVILGSLSIGYWYGGKLADRKPEIKILASMLFMAAAFIAAVSVLDFVIITFTRSFIVDLRVASLVAAILLFSPASICLGMVAPFAVRLSLNNIAESGEVVGRLYALSTIGSIFGTFLAGFFLIAFLGTTAVLLSLSVVLALTSLLALGTKPDSNTVQNIMLLFVVLSLRAAWVHYLDSGIDDIDTAYSRIWVMNIKDPESKRPVRILRTDSTCSQSTVFINSPNELYPNYTKFYRLGEHFVPEAERVLVIGGGGYSTPRDILRRNENVIVDVSEIDPVLTDIAREYFYLKDDPRMNIIHEDGRTFVSATSERYDAVYMDAFTSAATIPFHLTTREFAEQLRSVLNEKGVLVTNLISAFEGPQAKMFQSLYNTYKSVFDEVLVFHVTEGPGPRAPQNIVFVSTKNLADISTEADDEELNSYLSRVWKGKVPEDVPVLTDDYAPVSYYMRDVAQFYHGRFN